MKVYVVPADVQGCGYYRLIWPSQALISAGHDITIIWPSDRGKAFTAAYDQDIDEIVDVSYPSDADVIVLQRVSHQFMALAIPLMRERGVAVVIDVDDDLSRVDPANPSYDLLHPKRQKMGYSQHSWLEAERACANATLVQVSADALLRRYARHGRGVVLHNCVPEHYLDITHIDSEVIGYGAALITHRNDVPMLGTSIDRLLSEGRTFRTIGKTTGIDRVLGLRHPFEDVGPVDIDSYPHRLSEFGVGLAPLAMTEFNRSKSWLKPLELAAVGVPCVMSPRAEYTKINKLGIGVLAEKPRDWYREIRRIVMDAGWRMELSVLGRGIAREHTIEKNAQKWWDAWTYARELQDAA